jgi:hypothetical protein
VRVKYPGRAVNTKQQLGNLGHGLTGLKCIWAHKNS